MTHPHTSLQTEEELERVVKFLLGEANLKGMWFGAHKKNQPFWWRKELREAMESHDAAHQKELELAKADAIVLACPETDCNVAIVSSRELSRWEGTGEITDPPHATACWLPCEKHYEEGAIPWYTDKDGNEISADPETWEAQKQALLNKEVKIILFTNSDPS